MVYSSIYSPKIEGNPKVNVNLSDLETRLVSHQLGKCCVGCHPDFAGVVLNQVQLPSIWLCSPTLSFITQEEQGQCRSSHLQLGTGTAVAVCCLCVSLALGGHLPDLLSWQAGQKCLRQKHLEKREAAKLGLKELHTFSR